MDRCSACRPLNPQEELREFERRYNESLADWAAGQNRSAALAPSQELLLGRIRKAFAGVRCLGEKVVLLGGEALDDYASPGLIEILAQREERLHWEALTDAQLEACQCCLAYVGPEAYRFLLPAYMIFSLRYPEWEASVGVTPDTDEVLREYCFQRFALFTPEQQAVTSDFLNELRVRDLKFIREETYCFMSFAPWEWLEWRERCPQTPPGAFLCGLAQKYLDSLPPGVRPL